MTVASLLEIEEAIATTLKNVYEALPDVDEVQVFDTVPDVNTTPAMVVMPAPRDPVDFNGAFGRGTDTYTFDLIIMVAKGQYSVSQKQLAQYITGYGATSVREIIYNNSDLGLTDGTDANCDGVRLYGGEFENAKIPHVGAVVKITVRTFGP